MEGFGLEFLWIIELPLFDPGSEAKFGMLGMVQLGAGAEDCLVFL